MSRLKGTIVVVTGGGSGIGRALSLEAGRRGARLLVADVAVDKAASVADEIVAAGGQAAAAVCDVSDSTAVDALAAEARRRFGGVNLLCNNAGVCIGGTVEATSAVDVKWLFEVNVFGICNGVRSFAPLLREAAERGELAHILNTGSENSLGTPPLGPASVYNATKHAVLALSDTARHDLAPARVGVSVVCPSLVSTDLLTSRARRTERAGGPDPLSPGMSARVTALMRTGHDADSTAAIALDGVEAGHFIIVPHAEIRGFVEARMRDIAEALDRADASGGGQQTAVHSVQS